MFRERTEGDGGDMTPVGKGQRPNRIPGCTVLDSTQIFFLHRDQEIWQYGYTRVGQRQQEHHETDDGVGKTCITRQMPQFTSSEEDDGVRRCSSRERILAWCCTILLNHGLLQSRHLTKTRTISTRIEMSTDVNCSGVD